MKPPTVKEYGKSIVFETSWGLPSQNCQKIAAIIVYSGSIEYHLERAIWKCKGVDPKGTRPETDAQSVKALISMFKNFADTTSEPHEQALFNLWCAAAEPAFIIRNNIAHGVAVKLGDKLAFMRNPRWHGETRKRKFGDFWADENTLDLVCESFAVLLRIVVAVEVGRSTLTEIATPLALKALTEARSILGEFSSQYYNPSYEKY